VKEMAHRLDADNPQKGTAPRPLRIVMVAARYFPFSGGIETHIHEVGRRLAAQGHEVTVLTTDPTGALPRSEMVEGMRIRRVPAWPRKRDYFFAPGLFQELRRGSWDVVHVQGYHTFSAPIAMAGALAAGIPFVLTFHSGGHSSSARNAIRGVQQSLLRPLASRAAQLIGVSQFEADHFSAGMRIPRERFTVVPNGAQLPTVARDVPISSDAPLIVSLGRLERYKGHHRAIEAFAHLLKRQPDARLRILGEGPYEAALRSQVEKAGLTNSVEIGGIPATERARMAELLASAALVVLLSDYEAHPVAVMEALSLSLPVLATDTSGFKELAAAGLLRAVPLDATPEIVAQAMSDAIAAPPPTLPVKLPDWNDCAEQLLATYRLVACTSSRRQNRRDEPNISAAAALG